MFKLAFQFYKELFLINLTISIAVGLITVILFELIITGFFGFLICFASFGFLISAFYYYLAKPKQYYFYYNRGFSLINIHVFGFLINLSICLTLLILHKLWIYLK